MIRSIWITRASKIILAGFLATLLPGASEPIPKSWNGLQIATEHRCSPYDRRDYPYPRNLEHTLIERLGGIYEPYTGRYHYDRQDTEIDHIVALSEAHDSGMCAADPARKRTFAKDILNLTLATPIVNRCGPDGKCGKDITRWAPNENLCWFVDRIIRVKRKYKLTIDPREYKILWAISTNCTSTKMLYPNEIDAIRRETCDPACQKWREQRRKHQGEPG